MSMADETKLRSPRYDEPYPQGAGARPTTDPLAELARLIGQDDLFDQMRKEASTRSESRASLRGADSPPLERGKPTWLSRSKPAAQEDGVRGSEDVRSLDEPRSSYELRGSYDSRADALRLPAREPMEETQHGAYSSPNSRSNIQRDLDELESYANNERHDLRGERSAGNAPYEDIRHYATHDAAPAYTDSYVDDRVPDHHADAGYDQTGVPAGVYTDETYEEPPVERRRGGMMTVAAVLGIAVVGTAGAFGYRALTGSSDGGQPPVIKADNSPNKVTPAPQSSGSASKGVIYDRAEKPQSERVVSREEQPIEMREAKASAPKPVVPAVPGVTPPATNAAAVAPMAPPVANPDAPKKVKTFAIRPDGSIVTDATGTPAAPGATGPRVAAVTQPASGRGATPAPAARPAAAPADQGASPTQTAALPPSAGSRSATTTASVPTGSYVVQLVSNKSEGEAQAAFKGLQTKYPAVLGSRTALIRKVELGDKGTYYRAQVGPFSNVEAANELCGNLKTAGGQCIVQRN